METNAAVLMDKGVAVTAGEARVIPFAPSRSRCYDARLARTVSLLERAGEELLEAAADLSGARDAEPEALFESEDFRVRQLMRIREKMMIFLWDQEVGANPE